MPRRTAPDPAVNPRLWRAARIVRAGGVIVYPTEAVYGIGCDPRRPTAVRRVLALKKRPPRHGLILVGADFAQIEPWLRPLDAAVRARVCASWPGPVTWLLPARRGVSTLLRGRHTTLAVRVSAHPLVAALCRRAGTALVSTSANRRGRAPARNALAARRRFGGAVPVLAGPLGGSPRPSEIRALDGRVIRAG